MTGFLTVGIVLGLSAGFAPGPILALVISETMRHGIGAGIRVAFAPIVTDLPIILLTLLVMEKLSGFNGILGAISIAGGSFILFLAWENLRAGELDPDIRQESPNSLAKGIAANALSPYPYLFWLSVGAPQMVKALRLNVAAMIAFIAGFYICLVGAKALMAVLVGRSRSILKGRFYIYTIRFLGLLLALFAVILFRDGLRLLGVI